MAAQRTALGRGLGALIPSAPPTSEPAAPTPSESTFAAGSAILEIPVTEIDANPEQPRRIFDDADLDRLAGSLRRHGQLQPVVVRRSEGRPGRYELVVGERRWRAAQRAGIERIAATVKDVATPALLEVALIENVQRRDLNPIELALAFRTLIEGGATQEEIGRRVGLDRSTVANHVRLLDLPRELQEDVEEGRVSGGHAKALLQVSNPVRRRELRDRIVAGELSVRATEEAVRQQTATGKRRSPKARAMDPDLAHLVDTLRDHLKTRVRIRGTARRGSIELEFYGPEELQRLSQQLLGEA